MNGPLRRNRGLWIGLLVATVLTTAAGCGGDREPIPAVAEYADEPPIFTANKAETAIGREVEATGGRSSQILEHDVALSAAARNICGYILDNGADSIDRIDTEFIASSMRDMGLVDSAFRSVFLTAPFLSAAAERVDPMLAQQLLGNEYSHYGVGALRSLWPPGYVIGILLVRKTVALDPLPRRYAAGEDMYIQGRLVNGTGPLKLWVQGPTIADNYTVPFNAAGRFSRKVALREPGRYRVEVMSDGARGPEVAALFDVQVSGGDGAHAAPASLEREPIVTVTDARRRFIELINRERTRASLLPVGEDPALTKLAQSYAEEMASSGRVAHYSPKTGDVADRAEKEGILFWRISENIAVNQNVESVHEDLMGSPSHRANILDRQVDRLGIGVVFDDGGRSIHVVQNFARLR